MYLSDLFESDQARLIDRIIPPINAPQQRPCRCHVQKGAGASQHHRLAGSKKTWRSCTLTKKMYEKDRRRWMQDVQDRWRSDHVIDDGKTRVRRIWLKITTNIRLSFIFNDAMYQDSSVHSSAQLAMPFVRLRSTDLHLDFPPGLASNLVLLLCHVQMYARCTWSIDVRVRHSGPISRQIYAIYRYRAIQVTEDVYVRYSKIDIK